MDLERIALGVGEIAVMEQHEIFFQFLARKREGIVTIRHTYLLGKFRQAPSERRYRAM